MSSAAVESDPFAAKYWAAVDALPLADLREKEGKIFRAILDEQFRARKLFLRTTQKQDLSALTRIAKQNLAEPIAELEKRGMLQCWPTSSGFVFQAVMDPAFWQPLVSEFDRRGYNQGLAAIRMLNGFVDPDPSLPSLEPEKGLAEALGEVTNFVSTRSAGVSQDALADDHQNRGNVCRDAGALQGGNRESTPVNAVRQQGPAPSQGGVGSLRDDSESRAREPDGKAEKGIARLIEQMRAAAQGQMLDHEIRPAEESPVLKSNTGRPIREGFLPPPVLDSSTAPPKGDGREYLNQVLDRGRVLESSTAASAAPNIEHCSNASSKKHCLTLLTLFAEEVRTGAIVLERGATTRQISKWLEACGVFVGPSGHYFGPFWFKHLRLNKSAVEDCFFALMEQVRSKGVQSIVSPGAFMMDRMRWAGVVRREGA